ncbi:MAG: TIM barrel protein [Candidatus Korarchaeota archaeon]
MKEVGIFMAREVLIGPAISDLSSFNSAFLWKFIEIQGEREWLDNPPPVPSDIVVSVHSPAQGRDISSLNTEFRRFSIRETLRALKIVSRQKAYTFVLHPGQFYERTNKASIILDDYIYDTGYFWDRPEQRNVAMENFILSFQEIMNAIYNEGITAIVALENLEYPRFPADLYDLLYLRDRITELGFNFYMVLDIPHLWHSMRIMKEGGRWQMGEISFIDYVEKLFKYFLQDIVIVHLAGCKDHRTHEPIEYKESYAPSELDMREVAGIISRIRMPIVIETHSHITGLVRSTISLKRILSDYGIPVVCWRSNVEIDESKLEENDIISRILKNHNI